MANKAKKEIDWEFHNYLLDLEKQWKESLPRMTDKEFLEIFPEVKKVIPEKILEWEKRQVELRKIVEKKSSIVETKVQDEFSKWFWGKWIEVSEGDEWLQMKKQIGKLKRLAAIGSGKQIRGRVTQEQIEQAMEVPVESILGQTWRKSGKAMVGLCPLHEEKTPSFCVYPENNFYCFGCQQGGNTITLTRQLHGFSFPEAVKWLLNQ